VLTVHGRTRQEKGSRCNECDWDTIRRIKEHFLGVLPIIANGGIESMADVHRCLEYTGADAVMVSEALLENPALFAENIAPGSGVRMNMVCTRVLVATQRCNTQNSSSD
jgi:tRNA-dihydrouridine synthase